jgi:carotenoid 1,2-hydratase
LSDDGADGLTVIAFVGSVFSPYYARARRGGAAEPADYCAVNVALYGARASRWAMTERGRGALRRTAETLAVGPSMLSWDGTALTVHIDEVTAPLPSRLRGTVRLHPHAVVERAVSLDAAGAHRWRPIAPCARVEVAMESPALAWSGAGYHDANDGDAPLADAFSGWHWSRARTRAGTAVLYDVARRDGDTFGFGLEFAQDGRVATLALPAAVPLPRTRWGIARATRADPGCSALVRRTLEDTPFYARSLLTTRLYGEPLTAMHESLSLDRFRERWVQALLPFRMPRLRT